MELFKFCLVSNDPRWSGFQKWKIAIERVKPVKVLIVNSALEFQWHVICVG